ncbi:hypothetical protein GCM10020254_48780 [Streptomyces goshikiensis]
MAATLKDATAIVGIGQTPFAKRLPQSEKELACRAILAALADAGIAPSEVDAFASYTMEETDEVEVAKAIGAGDVTFFSKVGYGGGGSCATVGHLAAAVATGQASVGVAWRSRKRGSGPRPWKNTAVQLPTPGQWTRPFGLLRPADEIGMLARRYMHEYGATRDHLFNVAMACRNRANENPAAMMYERPLTREMYMTARMISEPLCLFDNCLETDGALACVIVSAERARDCRHKPVYVHSVAQGLPAQHHGMVNYWNDDPLSGPAWTAARHLWKQSDFGPQDVDVAQIYDAFTPPDPAVPGGLRVLRARRGRRLHRGRGAGNGRPAAHQHGRRRTQRGLRARLQPDQRGRQTAAGHLHRAGAGRRDLPGDGGRGSPDVRDPAASLRSERR